MIIKKILLVAALIVARPAGAIEEGHRCADALQTTAIRYTPAGPRLELGWRPGYESCEDFIRRLIPLVVEKKPCIGIEFLDGDRIIACLPRTEI